MKHTPDHQLLSSLRSQVALALLATLLSSFFLLLLDGEISLWTPLYSLPIAHQSMVLLALGVALSGCFMWIRPSHKVLPSVFGILLLCLFLSAWLTRPFSLLQGPVIRGEILFFSILAWLFWKKRSLLLPIACAIALISLVLWFFEGANGRLLFSDDNPTFLYRLMLLKEHFPAIPFYNPLWNAGIDARDFFATGTLNAFLLFSPLIYSWPLLQSYNVLVALLMFGLVPGATFLAAQLYDLSWRTALLASVLAVTSSLLWYRWALQFGTMGFITSAALLPLVLALGSRFFRATQVSIRVAVLTVIIVSLMLLWSPAGVACLPLIFFGLLNIKKLFRQKLWGPVVLLLICINLPWMSLFWAVSNVGSFLHAETPRESYTEMYTKNPAKAITPPTKKKGKVFKHKKVPFSLKLALKNLQEATHSAQPLLWIYLLPGLFLIGTYPRWILSLTAVWLLLLGSCGPMLKPQLELDRMLIMLLLLSAVPTARALQELLCSKKPNVYGALTIGFLFAGVLSAGAIVKNRTVVPISFQSDEVEKITKIVKEHTGTGRVLFSGFILHDFSGGHLAPLPLFAQKPVIASSPVHNLWRYQQVFPKEYISKGDVGIDEYLNLMNVSLVFAHERKWRNYFRSRPEAFTEIATVGKFSAFTRSIFPESYFLEGSGEVTSQSTGEVHFTLQSPNATLRFRYYQFIAVDGCDVQPEKISESITFTQLKHCQINTPLTLQSVSPVERWKQWYLYNKGAAS